VGLISREGREKRRRRRRGVGLIIRMGWFFGNYNPSVEF